MRNPLHIPRVLKDATRAIQASLPHAQRATAAGAERLELLAQLRDAGSRLSDSQRAAISRRIGELSEQVQRQHKAAERPYEELSARHPDWVDF